MDDYAYPTSRSLLTLYVAQPREERYQRCPTCGDRVKQDNMDMAYPTHDVLHANPDYICIGCIKRLNLARMR